MKRWPLFSSPNLPAPVPMFRSIVIIIIIIFISAAQALAQGVSSDSEGHVLSTQFLKDFSDFQKSKGPAKDQQVKKLKVSAEKRKAAMLKMLEKNPADFLRHAMPDKLRKQFPTEFKSLIEQKVQAEGVFTVIYEEDFVNQQSKIHYLLEEKKANGKTFKLHFAGKVPEWHTDMHVVVQGEQLEENIVLGLDGGGSSVGSTTVPLVSGNQSTAVILANFQNKPMECSAATVGNIMFSTANSFFQEVSFNHVSISGNVFGPFAIPHNSTDACSYSSWGTSLHNAALAAGVDLSQYSRLIYVFPNNSCSSTASGYGTVGGNPSKSWILGYCDRKEVYTHEFGHNLGMHHASAGTSEYGDYSDVMGYSWSAYFHMNAPHKAQMEWIPPSNVQNVTQSGVYTIDMLEQASGNFQALKIAKPDTQDNYVLGFRVPVGKDVGLGATYANKTNIHTHKGGSTKTFFISGLGDGVSFQDSANGISVTQLSHSATSSTVEVNFSGPVCQTANPLVSISPLSQSGAPGSSLMYSVSVTNKDSSSCPASNFQFDNAVLPIGFNGVFSPSMLSLSSGQSGSVQWMVSSSASTLLGSYAISAKAFDAAAPAKSATAQATYVAFIDNEPPVVSIVKPANMSVVKRNTTVEVSGSDNDGMGRVEFFLDGKLVGTDSSAPYTYTLNPRKLAAGQHGMMAIGFDKSGNSASDSIVVVK